MSWTAQAEGLEDTTGLARSAVRAQARALAAGLDPAVVSGLTGAALILGAPTVALMGRGYPFASDTEMMAAVDGLAGEIRAWWRAVRSLTRAINIALDAAIRRLNAELRRKKPSQSVIRACQREIADCETALGILEPVPYRLATALARLGQVPEDFGEIYEAPQNHVRRGGALPYDGHFFGDEGTSGPRGEAGTERERAG